MVFDPKAITEVAQDWVKNWVVDNAPRLAGLTPEQMKQLEGLASQVNFNGHDLVYGTATDLVQLLEYGSTQVSPTNFKSRLVAYVVAKMEDDAMKALS